MHAGLPVLEELEIATPCTASWQEMTGDDRSRHCASCDKDVFNLSGMSRDEATAFVQSRTGDACVRLFKRHDGTVITSDCPVGLARVRRRMMLVVAAVFSFLGLTAVAAAAAGGATQCDLSGDGSGAFTSSPTVSALASIFSGKSVPPPMPTKMMGKIAYHPPATASTPVTPASGNNGGTTP